MNAAIGIDVGGTKLLCCVVDEQGTVVAEALGSSPHVREGFVEALDGLVATALAPLSPARHAIVGFGLGLPGLVDRAGVLHNTPNLRALEETVVASELGPGLFGAYARWRNAPATDLRFVTENDATCAAAGELAFGAGRGSSDVVVVTLGTGIGGGFIAGGRLVLGGQGFVGEIGHMVVEVGGAPCVCGGAGCWEQYASGSGIARLARVEVAAGRAARVLELAGGSAANLRCEDVVAAAREGDRDANAILGTAASYLATGFSNLAEILDPSLIVVSGGLVEAADVYLAPAIARFAAMRRGSGPHAVRVVTARLGSRAGVIGAAALGLGLY